MTGQTVSGSRMAKSWTNYRTVIASPDACIEFRHARLSQRLRNYRHGKLPARSTA